MDVSVIVIMLLLALAIGVQMFFILKLYKKCGPNQVMIITGSVPDGLVVVQGGGSIVWPLINQMHLLSLETESIKFDAKGSMRSKDGTYVHADCQALVKVKAEETAIKMAAERFLNRPKEEMARMVEPIISGHLCALAAIMSVDEMRQAMGKLAQSVLDLSYYDLAKMGLTVESFTIKGIWETEGSINTPATQKTAGASSGAAMV